MIPSIGFWIEMIRATGLRMKPDLFASEAAAAVASDGRLESVLEDFWCRVMMA